MTSRGGLNQSLQLCMESQALVQTGTFVTKPVRVRSGYWPKILIFQLNQEFPDLVYFSREIGPNSVWILAKNPDFFNKIRSFQVPLTVSYTEPSIPSCVGGGGGQNRFILSGISAMYNFDTFRLELFSIRTLDTQVWGVGTKKI